MHYARDMYYARDHYGCPLIANKKTKTFYSKYNNYLYGY